MIFIESFQIVPKNRFWRSILFTIYSSEDERLSMFVYLNKEIEFLWALCYALEAKIIIPHCIQTSRSTINIHFSRVLKIEHVHDVGSFYTRHFGLSQNDKSRLMIIYKLLHVSVEVRAFCTSTIPEE